MPCCTKPLVLLPADGAEQQAAATLHHHRVRRDVTPATSGESRGRAVIAERAVPQWGGVSRLKVARGRGAAPPEEAWRWLLGILVDLAVAFGALGSTHITHDNRTDNV